MQLFSDDKELRKDCVDSSSNPQFLRYDKLRFQLIGRAACYSQELGKLF